MIVEAHNEFVKSLNFFCSKLTNISSILIIQDRLRDIVYLTKVLLNNTINQKYLVTEEIARDFLQNHFEKLRTELEIIIRKQSILVVNFKIMSSIRGNPCLNLDRAKVKQLCPPLSSSSIAIAYSDQFTDSTDKISVGSSIDSTQDPVQHPGFFVVTPSITRMGSIVHLEKDVENLEEQFDELKKEKERLALEISSKKEQLLNAINEVIELEISIQVVDEVIADKLYHFQSRIIKLETKRLEQFKNDDQNQFSNLLEQEIDEVKRNFKTQSKIDEDSRNQLTQSAQNFAASLGDVVAEYEKHSSDVKKDEFDKNMNHLKHLLSRPQYCHDENKARFYFSARGEKVYQVNPYTSHCILYSNGNRLRIKDGLELMINKNGEYYLDVKERNIYVMYYFKDSFGQYYVDINGDRCYKTDPEASEYKLMNGKWIKTKEGSYEKDEKGKRIKSISEEEIQIDVENFDLTTEEGRKAEMKSSDLNYIQNTVGLAIKKALAAVVIHQPSDPISYFANFLLQYRYNEQMFESRDRELFSYLQQRKEIQNMENAYCCIDRKISKLN